MIAIESFKKFRIKDISIIISLAILWLIFDIAINNLFSPQTSFILSLLIATILMSFTVHLIRKAGSAILFYVIGSTFTYSINNIGATGINKIIIFLIAGALFEIIFLIFKIKLKNIQIDIISATAISTATIPITMGFLISFYVATNMILSIINIMLLSFLIGFAGSIISFLIWHNIRNTKLILKYEYSI